MNSPLIIALDLEFEDAISLANQIDPNHCRVKVGSQLFTSAGPVVIEELSNLGFEIFLDLKFYDIPNTVSQAVKSAADLGVWMVNIHASGGSLMMKSARDALISHPTPPLLIAVTLLTSLGDEDLKEVGINDLRTQSKKLSLLSKESGLDGVVCAPQEVSEIKKLCGEDFITVTPGIRTLKMNDDQSRVSSPQEAIKEGADFLVIGRPITESLNPLKSIENILNNLEL